MHGHSPLEPDERILVVAGVSWQISTFENLTFATAADPGLAILGRSLDQDTIEAVMNGLRSGPLDSFPTGSYNIDDGADTVFRTADDSTGSSNASRSPTSVAIAAPSSSSPDPASIRTGTSPPRR